MGRAIDKAVEIIKQSHGEMAVVKLNDKVGMKIDVIPSGILSVDLALGVGGFPRGRITELFGPESSGKTTLALHVIESAQKMGLECAYIDVENALDATYMSNLGINLDTLFVSQPDAGEEALDITEKFMMSGEVGVIIVDSIDCIIPQSIIDANFGDSLPGAQARLMGQALRKMRALVNKSKTCLIFINQLRIQNMMGYGPKEGTSGGAAVKYYSSLRVEIKRISKIEGKEDDIIGNRVKIKTAKNKVSSPFKEAEFDIIYGKGADKVSDLLEVAVNCKVVDKSGSWFAFKSQRLGQGKLGTVAFLYENPDIFNAIKAETLKVKGL